LLAEKGPLMPAHDHCRHFTDSRTQSYLLLFLGTVCVSVLGGRSWNLSRFFKKTECKSRPRILFLFFRWPWFIFSFLDIERDWTAAIEWATEAILSNARFPESFSLLAFERWRLLSLAAAVNLQSHESHAITIISFPTHAIQRRLTVNVKRLILSCRCRASHHFFQ